MQLDKPSFSISFTREQADELVDSRVSAKGWNLNKVLQVKSVYHPYILFNFHGFRKSGEEKGEGVKDEIQEKMALDALTDEFSDMASNLGEEKPIENQVIKDEEIEALNPLIFEEEAKELLPLKLSAKFDIPRGNVFITGMRMVYAPEWKYLVEVDTKTYDFTIDAVNGGLEGDEKIPVRDKGWNEITKETISELQNPGAWVKYSAATVTGIASMMGGTEEQGRSKKAKVATHGKKSLLKELATNTRTQIIILGIIAAVVIILFYFGPK
ncbi:MAG: hypothetical protein ABID38_00150 [Candidatus Diapherotrites archaeon]